METAVTYTVVGCGVMASWVNDVNQFVHVLTPAIAHSGATCSTSLESQMCS